MRQIFTLLILELLFASGAERKVISSTLLLVKK